MNTLIAEYRKAALLHGYHTFSGEFIQANYQYEQLHIILHQIVTNQCEAELFQLFEEESVWVQLWAAAHTLYLDETRALEKLRMLQRSEIDLVSVAAASTMEDWLEKTSPEVQRRNPSERRAARTGFAPSPI